MSSMPVLADSCQIIEDEAVAVRAVKILSDSYAGESEMRLVEAPAPRSPQFKAFEIAVVNPRVYDAGSHAYLAVDQVNAGGPYLLAWLDLGFTFYKDKESGKFLNLAKAAGCATFGPVYSSLDEVVKP